MADAGAANPVEADSSPAQPLEYNRPRPQRVPTPLHSGIGVRSYFSLFAQAALFPLTAGALLFGWRALATISFIMLTAAFASAFWRRIGRRGWQVRASHCTLLAMMLGLMLPAHLFSAEPSGEPPWPIIPAAALALVMLSWLLGGIGAERIHPALITILLLFAVVQQTLIPYRVLRVDKLFVGDIMRGDVTHQSTARKQNWLNPPLPATSDNLVSEPASEILLAYTTGVQQPDRTSITPQMLIRDQLPPLEDLIIGGQPGPIGTSSAIAVIIGGLYLLYHGLIDFRIPLFSTLMSIVTFLILPIPVVISETVTQWKWFPFREHNLGWPTAITFINYEILASPLLFTVFFLASTSSIRPITRRGRSVFAIVLGILAAVLQLYESVAVGPYVALLLASLLTPVLDRLMGPRPLV